MANTFQSVQQIAFSALSFLEQRATLLNTIWKDVTSAGIAAETGETVTIRTPPSFTANSYNGSTLTIQDITEGKKDVVLNKDEEVTVRWSTREEAASIANNEQLVIAPAMDALLRKVEADLELDMRTDLLAEPRVFGDSAYAVDLEVADLAIARKELNEQNVPDDGMRSLWVSTKDGLNLTQKNTFTDRSASGKDTLTTGSLGVVYGFNVRESNVIVTNTGPDPDETYNLFYHRDAMAIAMRGLPQPNTPGVEAAVASHDGLTLTVTKQWDTNFQATVMVFRALYGFEMLDVNRAGILRG